MIQSIDLHDSSVVGYRIEGEMTADELKPIFDEVDRKIRDHKKLRVYAEYVSMDTITLRAIWEDIKFDLTHLTDFEKVAVVTDANWVGVTAKAASLIPGLEVRLFTFAEQQQALAWIKS